MLSVAAMHANVLIPVQQKQVEEDHGQQYHGLATQNVL